MKKLKLKQNLHAVFYIVHNFNFDERLKLATLLDVKIFKKEKIKCIELKDGKRRLGGLVTNVEASYGGVTRHFTVSETDSEEQMFVNAVETASSVVLEFLYLKRGYPEVLVELEKIKPGHCLQFENGVEL